MAGGIRHLAGLAKKLAKAQGGRCALCHREFADLFPGASPEQTRKTLEHVYPRSRYPALKHKGNVVAAHARCNSKRGAAEPTAELLSELAELNKRMGWVLSLDQAKTCGGSNVPPGAVLLLDNPAIRIFVWKHARRASALNRI